MLVTWLAATFFVVYLKYTRYHVWQNNSVILTAEGFNSGEFK
jgi:hypothetical protein